MRLIDADKLRHDMYDAAFIQDSDMQKWDGGCWIRYKMFEKTLDNQDEAIVRCKDCIYSKEAISVAEDILECNKLKMITKADWFCAEGKKKWMTENSWSGSLMQL